MVLVLFRLTLFMMIQTVQEMVMLSTSVLNIKWTIKGKPKSLIATVGGDLIVKINSKFTLNQISGQVIEHEETWDLSASSPIAQVFFWASRRLYATTEAGKDLGDLIKNVNRKISTAQENLEIYPDPSGDPSKVCLYTFLPGALFQPFSCFILCNIAFLIAI